MTVVIKSSVLKTLADTTSVSKTLTSVRAADEQRANIMKRDRELNLKAKARLWPRLPCVPYSLDGGCQQ